MTFKKFFCFFKRFKLLIKKIYLIDLFKKFYEKRPTFVDQLFFGMTIAERLIFSLYNILLFFSGIIKSGHKKLNFKIIRNSELI